MPITLLDMSENYISIYNMLDGDVAEIVEFPTSKDEEGSIVQRNCDNLIVLGADSGNNRTGFFRSKGSSIKVRILPKGTTLVIS